MQLASGTERLLTDSPWSGVLDDIEGEADMEDCDGEDTVETPELPLEVSNTRATFFLFPLNQITQGSTMTDCRTITI